MSFQSARGVRIDVGTAELTAKAMTALTAAKPGVATSVGHGLDTGALGYLANLSGFDQYEGQAVRVTDTSTDTVTFDRLDLSDGETFVSGDLIPIDMTSLAVLGSARTYSLGEARPTTVEQPVLLDQITAQTAGPLSAREFSIGSFSDLQKAGWQTIEDAAYAGTPLVFRIRLNNGEERVFRAYVGSPSESASAGDNIEASITGLIVGRVLYLPAVA